MSFLALSNIEYRKKNDSNPDFVLVTGDAYVDHPSFGSAIIARKLVSHGYKVAILAQPDFKDVNAFKEYGEPRLGFLVTAGNVDSMVNNYSVSKRKRKMDMYSPGGVAGKRPDRATIIYTSQCKKAFPNSPVIIGGIEASLRRLAHYDYWDNKVRRSILLDSKADLLIYGMAENTVCEVAEALDSGLNIRDIIYIKGTVWKTKDITRVYNYIELPSYDEIISEKKVYAQSFVIQYHNTDAHTAKTLVEGYRDNRYVVQNPPAFPLTEEEFDKVYTLPFERDYHPIYKKQGGVPAIEEVKFSIIANRGCFGSCNFCALTFHQGRVVQTRSEKSIINEAVKITNDTAFKGYIHDVGGPTANFYEAACEKQHDKGACTHKTCLAPKKCNKLEVSHKRYVQLLKKVRELPNVKKVFIRSGIRFDYLMADSNDQFFHELVKNHISGQLKVAPEHISDKVLKHMGKPEHSVYEAFRKKYKHLNEKYNMNQFLVPYLISSHPGATLSDAIIMAEYIRDEIHMPLQVQDFYPTPGTLSTCMYYTELEPINLKPIYVAKNYKDKAMQRALLQYKLPKNYALVHEALTLANRLDLIGNSKKALIKNHQVPNAKNYKKNYVKKSRANKGKGKNV